MYCDLRRIRIFLSVIMATLESMFVVGCSTVPSLTMTKNSQQSTIENPSIPVSEIVKRTKCELINALEIPLRNAHKNQHSPYYFIPTWVAKFDLTVTVNAQSGLSPGVSLINPLHQIADSARGTFPQSASLGIGAGYTGTASRIETLSYELSLEEVYSDLIDPGAQKHKHYQDCKFEQSTDLNGDLGLKEWIDASLNPLVNDDNFAYGSWTSYFSSFWTNDL
jgi:hypothetical protein